MSSEEEAYDDPPYESPFSSAMNDLLLEAAQEAMNLGLSEEEAVKAATDAYMETREEIRKSYLRGLHRNKKSMIAERESGRRSVEEAMQNEYGSAFANYMAASQVAYELGSTIHEEYIQSGAADEFLPSCQILFLLHGKACTIAAEVLHLLRGGFPDGANARHRTLYELSIIMDILSGVDREPIALRYIEYAHVERFDEMNGYQKHCSDLNYKPFTQEEMAEAAADFQNVIDKYGSKFRKRNGWAAPLFNDKFPISIVDLERFVGVTHRRPFYTNANHQVHAGPRAALLNLRSRGLVSYIGVGARSGEEVAEVAHGTLIYLLHCTACLHVRISRLVESNLDAIIGLEALQDLVEDAGKSFLRASRRIT